MAASEDNRGLEIAASDELKDIFCELCIDDGKQIQAQGFCVNCSEYLCGQCYKNHRKHIAFKNHALQDKDTMPVDARKTVVLDDCSERCALHPPKIVKYFCKSCDTLGCNACIAVNHRQCQHVNHIPDIVQNIEASGEFVEFTKNLDERVKALNKSKDQIISNKSETDEMTKLAREELKKQRDEINKFFDGLETEMESKIIDISNRNEEHLQAASNRSYLITDGLQKLESDIETNQKNGRECELFIAMKKSKSSMKQLDKEFHLLNKESEIQRYKLTQSRQIKSMLKGTTEICRMLTAEPVSELKVSTSRDKETPCIIGIAVVQQHYLVVADASNKSVKVIDTSNGILKSEICKDYQWLWNVTNVNDDKIAVSITTYSKQRKIVVLSVSEHGSLKNIYEIKTNYTCHELVSFKRLFCIRTLGEVKVIDTQGKILKSMKFEGNPIDGMALSTDNESIYVTNSSNNKVQRVNMDGKVEAVYTDKYLERPSTITVDREGFVYVRSGNACVNQLTENLSKVQILLKEPGGPITYSNREHTLYVGGYDGLVHLYKLK